MIMVIEPGNNVNSTGNAAGKTRQGNAHTGETASVAKPANPASSAGSDSVSLSNAGQSLSRLEASVANVPDVNAAKVAEIKASIAQGSYQVNAHALAGKMLEQEDHL